ncbi:hypothetical protein FCV25MIE_08954 [Fagus crenata]
MEPNAIEDSELAKGKHETSSTIPNKRPGGDEEKETDPEKQQKEVLPVAVSSNHADKEQTKLCPKSGIPKDSKIGNIIPPEPVHDSTNEKPNKEKERDKAISNDIVPDRPSPGKSNKEGVKLISNDIVPDRPSPGKSNKEGVKLISNDIVHDQSSRKNSNKGRAAELVPPSPEKEPDERLHSEDTDIKPTSPEEPKKVATGNQKDRLSEEQKETSTGTPQSEEKKRSIILTPMNLLEMNE